MSMTHLHDNEVILDVKNLRVAYGKVEALHEVSLTIRRGEIVTVIGPNGAGKTTLLSALMGLLPSDGDIVYMGHLQKHDRSVEHLVRHGMTLVPEKRELFAEMSVEDNLLLGAFDRYRTGHRDEMETMDEVFELFPRLAGAPRPAGRHPLRRRTPDARHGPRPDGQAQAADARRTQPRPGPADHQGNLPHHLGPQGNRRRHPARRTKRPRRAAGLGLWLRAGNRRGIVGLARVQSWRLIRGLSKLIWDFGQKH